MNIAGLLIGIAFYIALYFIGEQLKWYENRSNYDFESKDFIRQIPILGVAYDKGSKIVVSLLRKAKRIQAIYRMGQYRIRKAGKR